MHSVLVGKSRKRSSKLKSRNREKNTQTPSHTPPDIVIRSQAAHPAKRSQAAQQEKCLRPEILALAVTTKTRVIGTVSARTLRRRTVHPRGDVGVSPWSGISGRIREVRGLLVVRTTHAQPRNGDPVQLVHLLVRGLLVAVRDGDTDVLVGRGRRLSRRSSGSRRAGLVGRSGDGVSGVGSGCCGGDGGFVRGGVGDDLVDGRTVLVDVYPAGNLWHLALQVDQASLELDNVLAQLIVFGLNRLVGLGKRLHILNLGLHLLDVLLLTRSKGTLHTVSTLLDLSSNEHT